jgi:hypothetical protein
VLLNEEETMAQGMSDRPIETGRYYEMEMSVKN